MSTTIITDAQIGTMKARIPDKNASSAKDKNIIKDVYVS